MVNATPEEIRQKAAEVVARSEFELDARPEKLDLGFLKSIIDFIRNIFSPLSDAINSLHASAPILYWTLVITLGLLVVALLIHIIYSISRSMRTRREVLLPMEEDDPSLQDPVLWEERAKQLYTAGDFVGAVRCLFKASLLYLERSRKRKFTRGATNREYLRVFQKTEIFQPLHLIVDTIDRKWYGQEVCLQSDYENCQRALESIRTFASRIPNV